MLKQFTIDRMRLRFHINMLGDRESGATVHKINVHLYR